uniref:JmjC domain-containing protein 5 n=1 Tax=Caligus clemensi TaxID=344056 RepID=C1C1Z9_CALCM|nr:JmjC domain-containing protein 5 [Caligus clemensi]
MTSFKAKILSLLDNSKLNRLLSQSSNDTEARLIASLISKELTALTSYKNLSTFRDFIWEKLNTGHWKDVPRIWRDLYSATIIVTILVIMNAWTNEKDTDVLQDCIRLCDMGLLMGSTICNDICGTWAAEFHRFISGSGCSKRPKISIPCLLPSEELMRPSIPKIQCLQTLDFETFVEKYKETQTPVIIKGLANNWPARAKWSIPYIRSIAGYRTVPIEIGSRYTDGNWTQRLMTINAFIDQFIDSPSQTTGYLAQHNLMDQVSDLKEDIETPDYCFSGEEDSEDVNFWFGPCGTVSPLHTDPKHNILTQVVGYKYVRLYDPDQTKYLYSYSEEDLMSNTSQIDIENPDFNEFPEFRHALGLQGILEPGDALYIPPKMWHYVKSLSLSFSVSFWF